MANINFIYIFYVILFCNTIYCCIILFINLISINIYRDRIQFEVFSIYNDKRDIIIQNEIRIPVSFSMGDKLEYIRKFMSMIINQNKVKKAYLNIKDKLEVYTIKIEGTLEEVLSSYGVEICN